MEALIAYREKLVERLADAAREFCSAYENGNPSRTLEGDWTRHQIAAHVRDVDRAVYGDRVRRTLREDNPLFEGFDPDGWMAEHYNKDEPLQKILKEFKSNLDELCEALKSSGRTAWSRTSRHQTMGEGLTLQLWVERSLAHIEEHLTALKK